MVNKIFLIFCKFYDENEAHCLSIIEFAVLHNCVNRDFFTRAIKVDLNDIEELLVTKSSDSTDVTKSGNNTPEIEGDDKDQ